MARGKNERQRCQDDTVNARNNGQGIGPSDAAEAELEAIRFGPANASEFVRVPAEGERNASHYHGEGYKEKI